MRGNFRARTLREAREPQCYPQERPAGVDTLLMTIKATPFESGDLYDCHDLSEFHLTKTTIDFAKLGGHA